MTDSIQGQIADLERRARERFTDRPLTDAELTLLRAVPKGDVARCDPKHEPDADKEDLSKSVASAAPWDEKRQIRAQLIRWLCTDSHAKEHVDPKGIQISGAAITGALDLSFVTVPFPLTMQNCRILEKANMRAVDVPAINLEGTWVDSIDAESAKVKSSVELCNGFRSDGRVSLQGATIGGELNCNRARFHFTLAPADVYALSADYAVVQCGMSMSDHFVAEGEVGLRSAQIGGPLICSGGTFANSFRLTTIKDADGKDIIGLMNGTGSALVLEGATVKGNVSLDGANVAGEVSFRSAQLGGLLDCSGSKISNPRPLPGTGNLLQPIVSTNAALSADGAIFSSSVFLRSRFSAEGEVRFAGAQIASNLECIEATFTNAPRTWIQEDKTAAAIDGTGIAFNADAAIIKGNVFLGLGKGFSAEGQVRLMGTQVGGMLDCTGAAFKNPDVPNHQFARIALVTDGMNTNGDVCFTEGFNALGDVSMVSAQIGGGFDCTKAKFDGRLTADNAVVKGVFTWKSATPPQSVRISLINASVGALDDSLASWPDPNPRSKKVAGSAAGQSPAKPVTVTAEQRLDGFVYAHFTDTTTDPAQRLDWLRRQTSFTSQPYLQLAKALGDEGNDTAAKQVLVEMERRRRGLKDKTLPQRFWSWILKITIGYGYASERCLVWLLILIALGWAIFAWGYRAKNIAPTEKEAYAAFKSNGDPPAYYGRFHPFIYSLENSFPLVKLGQADLWQPDPHPSPSTSSQTSQAAAPAPHPKKVEQLITVAGLLLVFRWVQIIAGWILATLGVAGFSGIIRKD
jgi:hypothetical protein